MPKIKICGIKRLEDIGIVNKYKPDYIGFVFAESKRKVTRDLAYRLKQDLDADIIAVGVFVDSPVEEIVELFEAGIIEMAQLHGSESEQYIQNLKQRTDDELKIINAIEISKETDLSKFDNSQSDYLLFDSGKGSGKTFDWNLIKKDIKKEFFLAGGLSSSNVMEVLLI